MVVAAKVFLIGGIISYGIALLMKLTMVCIQAMTGNKKEEEQK